MKKNLLLIPAVLALVCLMFSCSYRCATVMPDEIREGGIALGTVKNQTEESLLLSHLKNAFAQEISKAPGMGRYSAGSAAYLVDLNITSMNTASLVSAEIREGVDDDNDDTAYQTILYEQRIAVEYALYKRAEPARKLLSGTVDASVVMPMMHDREVILRSSNQKVAGEAARKVVNAIMENW